MLTAAASTDKTSLNSSSPLGRIASTHDAYDDDVEAEEEIPVEGAEEVIFAPGTVVKALYDYDPQDMSPNAELSVCLSLIPMHYRDFNSMH